MPEEPWARIERVPPAQALARWIERRGEYNATGLWPIVVLDAEDLARFETRWEETRDEFEEVDLGIEGLEPDKNHRLVPDAPPGIDAPEAQGFIGNILQRTGTAWIVSLPCLEPAEIPARLNEGGVLDVSAEKYFAALRGWAQKHGAEPLFVGLDSLVLLVRPVQSLEEARHVAREQIEIFGEDEANEIVQHLVGLPVWFFWWD